ncbi:hypothetical protein [Rhizobium leguminosarum]|uniref:hypothetical protein n=1 Tax=Rhizobium leguminosarum TaxID=384 RepID=UPI00037B3C05|nr:hypothetical protein [Rhizobium leguminosarum]
MSKDVSRQSCEHALVCSECNAADGNAKRLLKIDKRFSFAAAEIRRFVKAAAHRDHEIDVEAARQVWDSEKLGFERRTALLKVLVDDLVDGRLQRRMEGDTSAQPIFKRLGAVEVLLKAFPAEDSISFLGAWNSSRPALSDG